MIGSHHWLMTKICSARPVLRVEAGNHHEQHYSHPELLKSKKWKRLICDHTSSLHPNTHTALCKPQTDGQCFDNVAAHHFHNMLQYSFILPAPHKTWGSRSVFETDVLTDSLCMWPLMNVSELSLTYKCDQVACYFYRGNSFLGLSGVWLGDFWISFTGTDHYWINHCGETDQLLRAIKRSYQAPTACG